MSKLKVIELPVVENICPYCECHLLMNKKVFANHVRWCKSNPKFIEKNNKFKEKLSNSLKLKNPLITYKFKCVICNKEYELKMTKNSYDKGEYKKTCSISCAHKLSALNSPLDRTYKIALGIRKYYVENGMRETIEDNYWTKTCPNCNKEFKTKKKNQEYCSGKCAKEYRDYDNIKKILKLNDKEKIKKIKILYRNSCVFKFSLNSYPNEFDFDLINKYGWYKAKNHGNNPNGISRDHIYSCNEGFINLIDPYILSHPANCQLIRQSKNASKHDKCNITLNSLKEKIKEWNSKYGIYPNNINYVKFELLGIKFNR